MNRNTLTNFLLFCVSLAFSLLVAEYILDWNQSRISSSEQMSPGLITYDNELGWRLNPNWQGSHEHYDYSVRYTTNHLGFRGQFERDRKHGVRTRYAMLGDSFTFGLGVEDKNTFTVELNDMDSSNEYLNLGVPGYSTDQELLLLRRQFHLLDIDHVVLLIYLGNDILDNGLDYPLQADNAKPFYRIAEDGSLILNNSPVPKTRKSAEARTRNLASIVYGSQLDPLQSSLDKLLQSSQLLQLFPSRSSIDQTQAETIVRERLSSQSLLLKTLLTEIKKYLASNGGDLTLVALPGRSFVEQIDSASGIFQEYVRSEIKDYAKLNDIGLIDVATLMREQWLAADKPEWFHPNEGHYNSDGNIIVAKILFNGLHNDDRQE